MVTTKSQFYAIIAINPDCKINNSWQYCKGFRSVQKHSDVSAVLAFGYLAWNSKKSERIIVQVTSLQGHLSVISDTPTDLAIQERMDRSAIPKC